MTALLDTHVLIWWLEDRGRLSPAHKQVLDAADPRAPLLLSDISLWEIATLHEHGRIELTVPLREWLERATAPPLVKRCEISPAVAAAVASLPPTFPRDPADRIIVSTARVRGATLLTCDTQIIESNVVATLE